MSGPPRRLLGDVRNPVRGGRPSSAPGPNTAEPDGLGAAGFPIARPPRRSRRIAPPCGFPPCTQPSFSVFGRASTASTATWNRLPRWPCSTNWISPQTPGTWHLAEVRHVLAAGHKNHHRSPYAWEEAVRSSSYVVGLADRALVGSIDAIKVEVRGQGRPGADSELGENVAQVVLDRGSADRHLACHFAVGGALGHRLGAAAG